MNNEEKKKNTIHIAKIFYDKLVSDQYRFGFESFSSLCNKIFYNTDLKKLEYRSFDFNHAFNFKFKFNNKSQKKYDDFSEWQYEVDKNFLDKNLTKEKKENIRKIYETTSSFFRLILINYLEKSSVERERFLFKDNFDKIEEAIENKKKLKIKYNNKESIVEAYFIKIIEGHPFNLIFSYSDWHKDKHYVTYHLSKIKEIKILEEDWKHYNKKEIKNKEANFELYETESKKVDIFIKLNKDGKFIFDRYTYNRPNNYIRTAKEKERETKLVINFENFKTKYKDEFPIVNNFKLNDDEYLYHFKTSIFRVKLYFTSFSKNFEILHPPELRKEFKEIFLKAYENHK